MRSANPTLKAGTFEQFRDFTESSTMTIGGTASKTLVLLLSLAASAAFSWNAMMNGGVRTLNPTRETEIWQES